MTEEYSEKIHRIMESMDCPKDFQCVSKGVENICKAEDIGLERYLVCLEDNPSSCSFAVPFGYGHYCSCEMRIFLSREAGITVTGEAGQALE